MIRDGESKDNHLIVIDAERAVVLGESFVEPHGCVIESIADEQVRELVKDYCKVILEFRVGCQCDVVNIGSRLKVPAAVCSDFERRIRTVVLEDHHGGGYRRLDLYVWKKPGKHFSKLLELQTNLLDVFFTGIADQ